MRFQFDIDKTIAAVAYLMEREGGELDMFLGLKMLYLADKEALVRWGKPITGDSFVALPKGPVLNEVYDLFKGVGPERDQKEWDAAFSDASTIRFTCSSVWMLMLCPNAKWKF